MGTGVDALPYVDALIKEYLLFRGFTATLSAFNKVKPYVWAPWSGRGQGASAALLQATWAVCSVVWCSCRCGGV
jgi:hypothetical protein